MATVSTILRCATDRIAAVDEYYVLNVVHVDTFPGGKGFMPSFDWRGRWHGNGKVCKTYEEAVSNGFVDLVGIIKRDEADYKAFCDEQDELRRRREALTGIVNTVPEPEDDLEDDRCANCGGEIGIGGVEDTCADCLEEEDEDEEE